jgi:G:T-mismatch repair DNA endonuclease (very short patch repair protein)
MWKDENYKNSVMEGLNIRPNNIESLLEKLLSKLFPLKYKFVGDFSLWINGKNPDFINEDDKKIIELFGSYWHSEENTGLNPKKHELQRRSYFEEVGYKVLIIWEDELKNISLLKEKLVRFNNA